jgi:hypothetical protein
MNPGAFRGLYYQTVYFCRLSALRAHIGTTDRGKGAAMHPMFVKLYLETDTDEDEQDRRRRAARVRRRQARVVVRVAARDRDRRPRQ